MLWEGLDSNEKLEKQNGDKKDIKRNYWAVKPKNVVTRVEKRKWREDGINRTKINKCLGEKHQENMEGKLQWYLYGWKKAAKILHKWSSKRKTARKRRRAKYMEELIKRNDLERKDRNKMIMRNSWRGDDCYERYWAENRDENRRREYG